MSANDKLMIEITHYLPHDVAFVRESNRIEGIKREPTFDEMEAYLRFMAQDKITLADMIEFVSVYQPDAELRERRGMNVMVGGYFPPVGDITIRTRLEDLLTDANTPFDRQKAAFNIHKRYESLHPFMDGNGRSGRMLWMWMMQDAPLGFLHTWYYQTLAYS